MAPTSSAIGAGQAPLCLLKCGRVQAGAGVCSSLQAGTEGAGGYSSVKCHDVGPRNTNVYQGARARWIKDQTSLGVRHPCVHRNAGQAFPGTGSLSWSISESWTPRIRARASSLSNRRISGADVLRHRRWAGAALLIEVGCRRGCGSSKQS